MRSDIPEFMSDTSQSDVGRADESFADRILQGSQGNVKQSDRQCDSFMRTSTAREIELEMEVDRLKSVCAELVIDERRRNEAYIALKTNHASLTIMIRAKDEEINVLQSELAGLTSILETLPYGLTTSRQVSPERSTSCEASIRFLYMYFYLPRFKTFF